MKAITLYAIIILSASRALGGESKLVSYTLQWQAYAPNAGGQKSYGLRRSTESSEWSLFMNEYLLANDRPLIGGVYSWRFPICGSACPLQIYGQGGLGLSSGGVLGEIGWSFTALWVARVDVLTQIYASQTRLIGWSYPLWFGISIPLP